MKYHELAITLAMHGKPQSLSMLLTYLIGSGVTAERIIQFARKHYAIPEHSLRTTVPALLMH